jgi:hypothetical protein
MKHFTPYMPISLRQTATEHREIYECLSTSCRPSRTHQRAVKSIISQSGPPGRPHPIYLRTNLYRDQIPDVLKNISWIEEKVCALHRVSADIYCLHNLEHDNILLIALLEARVHTRPMFALPRVSFLVFLLT